MSRPRQKPALHEKITIALIGVFAFLQVYSVQAILPILMDDLNATEVQAGLSVGATVMAIALMSPFTGMLSDAFGRKRFIVGSLLLLSVPTALIAFSQSVEMLTLWRFLQGLAVPGITVVLIAYIGEEYSDNLASMMSLCDHFLPSGPLELKALKPGVIQIFGVKTSRFLCQGPDGKLYGSVSFQDPRPCPPPILTI